jgi:hypothetical protein
MSGRGDPRSFLIGDDRLRRPLRGAEDPQRPRGPSAPRSVTVARRACLVNSTRDRAAAKLPPSPNSGDYLSVRWPARLPADTAAFPPAKAARPARRAVQPAPRNAVLPARLATLPATPFLGCAAFSSSFGCLELIRLIVPPKARLRSSSAPDGRSVRRRAWMMPDGGPEVTPRPRVDI